MQIDAAAVVRRTRDVPSVALGASPRAGLALQAASQAAAALAGRDFVAPDDVKQVAVAVLGHRVITESSWQLRGLDGSRIVRDILDTVPVPVTDDEV